jgi:hypothetical protein
VHEPSPQPYEPVMPQAHGYGYGYEHRYVGLLFV